jgi:hypothetical protein
MQMIHQGGTVLKNLHRIRDSTDAVALKLAKNYKFPLAECHQDCSTAAARRLQSRSQVMRQLHLVLYAVVGGCPMSRKRSKMIWSVCLLSTAQHIWSPIKNEMRISALNHVE